MLAPGVVMTVLLALSIPVSGCGLGATHVGVGQVGRRVSAPETSISSNTPNVR